MTQTLLIGLLPLHTAHCGPEKPSARSISASKSSSIAVEIDASRYEFTNGSQSEDGAWIYFSSWDNVRGITLRFPKTSGVAEFSLASDQSAIFLGEFTIAPGPLAGPNAVLETRSLASSNECSTPSGQIVVTSTTEVSLNGTFSGVVCDAQTQFTLTDGNFLSE